MAETTHSHCHCLVLEAGCLTRDLVLEALPSRGSRRESGLPQLLEATQVPCLTDPIHLSSQCLQTSSTPSNLSLILALRLPSHWDRPL